jgi:hypothetical protein
VLFDDKAEAMQRRFDGGELHVGKQVVVAGRLREQSIPPVALASPALIARSILTTPLVYELSPQHPRPNRLSQTILSACRLARHLPGTTRLHSFSFALC